MTNKLTSTQTDKLLIALGNLQSVSDGIQDDLNRFTVSDVNDLGLGLGAVLSASRTVDTLERVCSELHALIGKEGA